MRESNSLRSFWLNATCLIALLTAVSLPMQAQYSSGIEGTVTDQSGAVVPDAQVVLTNQETQVTQTATANSQGLVRLLHLPPGRYAVSISAAGFSEWKQSDINV